MFFVGGSWPVFNLFFALWGAPAPQTHQVGRRGRRSGCLHGTHLPQNPLDPPSPWGLSRSVGGTFSTGFCSRWVPFRHPNSTIVGRYLILFFEAGIWPVLIRIRILGSGSFSRGSCPVLCAGSACGRPWATTEDRRHGPCAPPVLAPLPVRIQKGRPWRL